MNAVRHMLRKINLDADTRIIVPYACNKDTLYQAWYDAYQIQYDAVNETVILVSHDDQEIYTPLVYMYDRYHSQLTVIFEHPADRVDGLKRPFIRITVLRKYTTETIDAPGPIFVITELDTPEL